MIVFIYCWDELVVVHVSRNSYGTDSSKELHVHNDDRCCIYTPIIFYYDNKLAPKLHNNRHISILHYEHNIIPRILKLVAPTDSILNSTSLPTLAILSLRSKPK